MNRKSLGAPTNQITSQDSQGRNIVLGKLIKTQDIDEFSEIITIPDKAINETIILNVRKLDEENDFGRAIKEILYDPNETPHGPTEIADIITSLHIHGVKKNAAFVLKPKFDSKRHKLLFLLNRIFRFTLHFGFYGKSLH